MRLNPKIELGIKVVVLLAYTRVVPINGLDEHHGYIDEGHGAGLPLSKDRDKGQAEESSFVLRQTTLPL
jgi:hypothetical protein